MQQAVCSASHPKLFLSSHLNVFASLESIPDLEKKKKKKKEKKLMLSLILALQSPELRAVSESGFASRPDSDVPWKALGKQILL